MKTEGTEALGRERAKQSKIQSTDLSRTARTTVCHYNGTQYCSTDSFVNIALPPDQHHISDVAKWR